MAKKYASIRGSATNSRSAVFNLSGATSVDHRTIGGDTYHRVGGQCENGHSAFRLEAEDTVSQTSLPASVSPTNVNPVIAIIDGNDPRSVTSHTTRSGQTHVGGFDVNPELSELHANGGQLGLLQKNDQAASGVETLQSLTLDRNDSVLASSVTLYNIGAGGPLTVPVRLLRISKQRHKLAAPYNVPVSNHNLSFHAELGHAC